MSIENISQAFAYINLEHLLTQKGLAPTIFSANPESSKTEETPEITLDSPISVHAKWAFNNIYNVPYPGQKHYNYYHYNEDVPRFYHGIAHVSRVAIYSLVFANLYRRYQDPEALALTPEDMKLITIAALFHDTAREDDGADRWDHESGLLLYSYLTKVLRVSPAKAKLLAEAIANKDEHHEGHYLLNIDDTDGRVFWELTNNRPKKNIYQKIIQNADCLDIIRARDHFDANYLDFYKDIAQRNETAFEEMALLITEARSLIAIQGDTRNRPEPAVKKKYDRADAFAAINRDITPERHPILHSLFNEGQLLEIEALLQKDFLDHPIYDKSLGVTESNLTAALHGRGARLFARGIHTGPATLTKMTPEGKPKKEPETMATVELRKYGRTHKDGNPNRSCTQIGWGIPAFADAGFLIMDPEIARIRKISLVDTDTGRGKKAHLNSQKDESQETKSAVSKEELADLLRKSKIGGESIKFSKKIVSTHNEILYDIRRGDFSAIYFSHDPNLMADGFNFNLMGKKRHIYSPILQAIFLQREHENKFGEKLPIFEYSSQHNYIKGPQSYNDDDIVFMWEKMCSDFMMQKLSETLFDADFFRMSVDDIKIYSMFPPGTAYADIFDKTGTRAVLIAKANPAAGDTNYPPELISRINQAIEEKKESLIKEFKANFIEKIKSCTISSVLSDEGFLPQLIDPTISLALADEIRSEIAEDLTIETLMNSNERFFFFGPQAINSFLSLQDSEKMNSFFDENLVLQHSSKLIRAYKLAMQIADKDFIALVKNLVLKKIERVISRFDNIEDISDPEYDFTQLIMCCRHLQVFDAKKDKLLEISRKILKNILEKNHQNLDEYFFQSYLTVVNQFRSLGMLDKNNPIYLRALVEEKYKSSIANGTASAEIVTFYLGIANILEISQTDRYQLIFSWIFNNKTSILELILDKFFDNENMKIFYRDINFFKVLLMKFENDAYQELQENKKSMDFFWTKHFLRELDSLVYVVKRQGTEEIIGEFKQLIQQQLENFYITLFANSHFPSMKDKLSGITQCILYFYKTFENSDFKPPLPKILVKQLEAILKDAVSWATLDISAELLQDIGKIAEKLEGNETVALYVSFLKANEKPAFSPCRIVSFSFEHFLERQAAGPNQTVPLIERKDDLSAENEAFKPFRTMPDKLLHTLGSESKVLQLPLVELPSLNALVPTIERDFSADCVRRIAERDTKAFEDINKAITSQKITAPVMRGLWRDPANQDRLQAFIVIKTTLIRKNNPVVNEYCIIYKADYDGSTDSTWKTVRITKRVGVIDNCPELLPEPIKKVLESSASPQTTAKPSTAPVPDFQAMTIASTV